MYLDAWGAGPFIIKIGGTRGGRAVRFEDSDRFGPSLVTPRGEIMKNQPGERSPFWLAHRLWVSQGRRLAPDGMTCVYDPPRPTLYRRDGRGRKWIVQEGDEGAPFREVDDGGDSEAGGPEG
jgi:hypothetical protein